MDAMNLGLMVPELFLIVLGMAVMMLDLFMAPEKRHHLGWIFTGGIALVTIYLFTLDAGDAPQFAAFGLYRLDGFAIFMKKVFALAAILVGVMSVDYMKRLGYTTGIVGKWHLGVEDHFHPRERGFDEWYFFRGGSRSYWEIEGNRRTRLEAHPGPVLPVTYLTDDLGAAACRFIARNASEPFFLFLSFNAPHTPLQAKPTDVAKYEWIESNRH